MGLKASLAQQRDAIEGRLKTLSTRSKLFILIMTVGIICGGFWYFFYQDYQARIAQRAKEIDETSRRLEQLKKAERMSHEIEKQLAEAEAKLKELLVFLPDIREIPSVLENISGLGSKAGLKQLILFEPKGEEIREFHVAIPIQLEMVGEYHRLGAFYDELSRTQRVIRVRDFTMKRQAQMGDIHVDCTVETYRYLETPPEGQQQGQGKAKK